MIDIQSRISPINGYKSIYIYISEDDDGLIDLLMELYTLSNYVPTLGTYYVLTYEHEATTYNIL